MRNIFLFSDYLNPIGKHILFITLVFARAFVVLSRWNKKIIKRHFYYSSRNNFSNSLMIIEFDFKNVLYYKINNVVKTTETKPIILNINNYHKKEIIFEIVGLFQKRKIVIPIKISNHLHSIKTQAVFSKSLQLELHEKIIMPSFKDAAIKEKLIELRQQFISLTNTLYNQNDFL